jgi:hypothetical protein
VSQGRALAALFAVLTLGFAALAVWSAAGAGGSIGRWVVAGAAAALAGWCASLVWPLARRH